MNTTQNDYNALLVDIAAMNGAKVTYHAEMQKIQFDRTLSEEEKSRRMREAEQRNSRASTAALEAFDTHLNTLQAHILADMKEWPNAGSAALSVVMALINAKQQPDFAMLKAFIGDIVTMNSLSALLKAAHLDDLAKPFTLSEFDLSAIVQRAYGSMSNARASDDIYGGNAAGRVVSKLAPITGHVMDMRPSDDEQVAAALRGAGLQP